MSVAVADVAVDVSRPTTVVIVDDHRSFAELLSAALNSVAGMACLDVATTADAGVDLVARLRPDVVVMDLQMPGVDGLAATRRIRELVPSSVIAILTAHREPEWIARAALAGASAFIPKNGSLTELISVLTRVRAGHMLVASSVFDVERPGSRRIDRSRVPPLTPREREVLTQLGKGATMTAIARILGVSVHTCRGYMKSLHTKLGVGTQLEVVIKAQELGLIDPPHEP